MLTLSSRLIIRSLGVAGSISAVTLGLIALAHGSAKGESKLDGSAIQELLAHPETFKGTVSLPVIACWYKGQPAVYIRTDASDAGAAQDQGVNLVPQLANAIKAPGGAVDDIYQVTNFTQGNVIPSAPIPAGPSNTDAQYTPLWQVTLVTWASGVKPHILKSEEEVLAARDAGKVTLNKTEIVVNCPVIYTPFGGQLPNTKIKSTGNDD